MTTLKIRSIRPVKCMTQAGITCTNVKLYKLALCIKPSGKKPSNHLMNKVYLLNTITTLHLELTKRLAEEIATNNNPLKISEYKRQLQEIETEIDRINKERHRRAQ